MTPALILSMAICVTMFALGFGLLLPITSAFSGFADLVGSRPEWWFSVNLLRRCRQSSARAPE